MVLADLEVCGVYYVAGQVGAFITHGFVRGPWWLRYVIGAGAGWLVLPRFENTPSWVVIVWVCLTVVFAFSSQSTWLIRLIWLIRSTWSSGRAWPADQARRWYRWQAARPVDQAGWPVDQADRPDDQADRPDDQVGWPDDQARPDDQAVKHKPSTLAKFERVEKRVDGGMPLKEALKLENYRKSTYYSVLKGKRKK